MDYQKIYRALILKTKSENRIKGEGMYYEKHHIILDFMFKDRKRKGPKGHLEGKPNAKSNIVLLTAKEHFIAHLLLYKIYKGTHYEYPCASALQFFFSKVIGKHPRNDNFSCSKRYEMYRILGLNAISKARKGTFPAKDSETGESVGSVSVDHPNVISGKWVHRTKGRIFSDEEKQNIKARTQGSDNGNYKDFSQDERLLKAAKLALDEDGYLIMKRFYKFFNEGAINHRQKMSMTYIANHYGSPIGFVKYLNEIGIKCKFDTYHRIKTKKRGNKTVPDSR